MRLPRRRSARSSSSRDRTDFHCSRRWSPSNRRDLDRRRRVVLIMFSPALEAVLTVAFREATSRRHTHLTVEHLLYALAHDQDSERILIACGADLPQLRKDLDRYLQDRVEQFTRQPKEPEQTLAFRRVLQTA